MLRVAVRDVALAAFLALTAKPATKAGITALEATHGQTDGFLSHLSYKCHLEEGICGRLT